MFYISYILLSCHNNETYMHGENQTNEFCLLTSIILGYKYCMRRCEIKKPASHAHSNIEQCNHRLHKFVISQYKFFDSFNSVFPNLFSSKDPSGHVQNIRRPRNFVTTYIWGKASGGMLLRKIFEFWVAEMAFPAFWGHFLAKHKRK